VSAIAEIDFAVSPTGSVDFGGVNIGSYVDRTFTVSSTRGGTVSGTVSSSPPFSIVSGGSFTLVGPGATRTVTVRFTPTTSAIASVNLNFSADGDQVSRLVSGTGIGISSAVTITALDGTATEAGATTGAFRVSRTGSTASPLTVFYSVAGTATPGTDYTALPGSVTIPAGVAAANILVKPINDTLKEGNQTVVVTLSSKPAYTIGSPSAATVTIISNE
jgi:hypothetical protein